MTGAPNVSSTACSSSTRRLYVGMTTETAGVDVEKASDGRFSADPTAVYDRWDEFVAWFQSSLDVPGGVTDEDSFTVWLMSRIGIPGG